MAAATGVNIDPPNNMETENRIETESVSDRSPLEDIEFQASQIIDRFEEAAELAETRPPPGAGRAWAGRRAGVLPSPGRPAADVAASLVDLVAHEDGGGRGAVLPPCDGVARLAAVGHAVAAYAGGLDREQLQRVNGRVAGDTCGWLGGVFRFQECGAFYHEDSLEGLVRLTRMNLHHKYPRYLEDGFDALTSRPPVIYSSVASPLGVVQHVCRQLGLPMFCIRPVPCNTVFGSQQKIDVAALERLLDEDKTANRVPLVLLADAGTPIAGHVDNLSRLQELCDLHDVWLHLRGHCLAALAMTAASPDPTPKVADSLTLPIGVWLGIPALPVVTLYREPSPQRSPSAVGAARESTLALLAGLRADQFSRRLSGLPVWTTLQALGRDGVKGRVSQAFESSEEMWRRIAKYPCLRLLSPEPGGEGGTYSVQELVAKPVSPSVLFDVVACSVVFQFVPEPAEGSSPSSRPGRVHSYYDKLNSWLGQILQRDAPQVPVEICDLETSGVVLRYCPLENTVDSQPSVADMDAFAACVEQQLDILTATVQHKETFQRLVSANPRLRAVEMQGWAGLGGVQYAPEGWEQLLTDRARDELNKLNMTLVESLRSTDAAFSLGEGVDGLVCVRFGMVTAETDVEELLGLVVSTGKEVEESSKFLDTMTEIVKKGIEAVTLDLRKENQERLWQEGILRHVPVFGSLVNWWSPPSKEGGIKGRSLNLQAGVVESTENIYRYHMQLQQGASSPPGVRPPPAPQVQTPVASGQHSRSSSHGSQPQETS